MTRFVCRDYGFECEYETEGKSLETLERFGKHSKEEHGIEYSNGSLIQFLIRKAEKDPSIIMVDLNEDDKDNHFSIGNLLYCLSDLATR